MEDDSVRAEFAEFREFVAQHLSANFECVWKAAAPLPPNTDDDALRAGIVDAAAWCLCLHLLGPLKRYADNRKALLRVQSNADIVAAKLDDVSAHLDELFPWSRDLVFKHWKLIIGNSDPAALLAAARLALRELALIAAQHAALLRSTDIGGRPRLVVFQVLIMGLARGYKDATGRRPTVTYDSHQDRHGGPFVRLVDAVLPMVVALASALSERAFQKPASDYARGQLIKAVLRQSRKAENPTEVLPR